MFIKQNNNLRGFIQIPLLIAIIAGLLVVGGAGYFSVKQYQNYQTQKISKEQELKKAQDLLVSQQKITEQEEQDKQKLEMEKIKKEVEDLKKKPQNNIPLPSTQNATQNPAPQQQEDSNLKIAKCQAEAQSAEDKFKIIAPNLTPLPLQNLLREKDILSRYILGKSVSAEEIASLPSTEQQTIQNGTQQVELLLQMVINPEITNLRSLFQATTLQSAQNLYNQIYGDCLNK